LTGNHYANGGSSSTHAASRSKTGSLSNKSSSSITYHPSVNRDSKGRIIRSEAAKEAFLKSRGLKRVPPGYEVDHKIPLWAGGSDTPGNMQLLTKEQHKAKTKADYKKYGH
jgi:5-methylcytosine-specific restriction endonuclease McrA